MTDHRPSKTMVSDLGRDEWTMSGMLNIHGTSTPFESHWVRREWADAEISRLSDEYQRGYRAGALEARRQIERNGSMVGAATNDWFDAVAADETSGGT